MDVVTLSLAKQYTDSQRIAYEKWESVTMRDDGEAPIPPGGLIGAKVVDYADNRLILTTPERPPEAGPEAGLLYADGDSYIHYIDYNGALDKKCLVINGPITGPYAFDGYALMYAFEETHDKLGMGVTFTPGWYAVTTSFAYKEADLSDIPVFVVTEELANGITSGYESYVNALFRSCKTISYTIGAENISDNGWVLPIPARYVAGENDSTAGLAYARIMLVYCPLLVNYNDCSMRGSSLIPYSNFSVTISYPVLKRIDPKFIPAMDSLTLNGADGKQYRLAVNETGALAATVIE